ncbi:hypothetical protein [Rhizobium phage RHph_X2_26]|nr:hypothetical protein [Rhizobium phage RHph_X2_26]
MARDYTAKAIEVINAGEAIKVRVKEANEDLGRAFDAKRRVIMDACLEVFRVEREAGRATIVDGREAYETGSAMDLATAAYYGMPYGLHQWRAAKHAAMVRAAFGATLDATLAEIDGLAALRDAVKAVPVVAREAKGETTEQKIRARVLKSFAELSAERRAQFDWATAIIRELNAELPEVKRLPVSVNHVYCSNMHGTNWLRIDWYFRGQKTAFNVIAAAAEKVTDEKK